MSVPAKQQDRQQEKKVASPADGFRAQLEQRLDGFADALPEHITPQRFKSIIMWAVMADPDLLAADRVSLFEACLAAANDGLLPDKKEGALVVYNVNVAPKNQPKKWIKKVQWMPMIRGIFTKLYNTGKVKSATVGLVYEGDQFRAWTDDDGEHVYHEEGEEQNRDVLRRIYAAVYMKDGGVFVETMRTDEIEKIKSKSKASQFGPWVDWWEEMAKKSVFRRLAKRLPMARDLAPVISRDDILYDLDLKPAIAHADRPKSIAGRLDALAAPRNDGVPMTNDTRQGETIDSDTGEIIDEKSKQQQKNQNTTSTRKNATDGETTDVDSSADAEKQAGEKAADTAATSESAADNSKGETPVEKAARLGRAAARRGQDEDECPYDGDKQADEYKAWMNAFAEEVSAND